MDVATSVPTTSPTMPAKTAASTAASAAASTDFNTFLMMLTTQLQNQDPLNPVDSADFAVQLATFSGVEQQVQTNTLLTSLATQLGANGLSQMAGWVGMEAKAAAPAYFYGDPVAIWPSPDSTADKAQVVVKNAFGSEVGRYDIGLSNEAVSWSGIGTDGNKVPEGLYTFQVESSKDGVVTSSKQAQVYSLITEAQVVNGETVLVLLGDTKIKAADVQALRNQPL